MSKRFNGFAAAVLAWTVAATASAADMPPLVDGAWLAQRLNEPTVKVLDIRGEAYAAGHIPGAIRTDYAKDPWRVDRDGVPGMLPEPAQLGKLIGGLGISNRDHVVIVTEGTSASDYGSATRIYWTFKVVGHDAVSILNGGQKGWAKDGRAVVTDASKTVPATFQVAFQPELVADQREVQAALAKGVPVIDNRPEAQFRGDAKHPAATRPGTIAGARSLPEGNFYDAATGKFAAVSDLSKLWQSGGLKPEGEQITFCNTGHWASLGWFASFALLGNKQTKLYDGSMVEWASRDGLPMDNVKPATK